MTVEESRWNELFFEVLNRIAAALEKQNEFQERKAKAIEGIEAKGKSE